jgi:hypothetical protein
VTGSRPGSPRGALARRPAAARARAAVRAAAAAVALALLPGCPLPQPLPSVNATPGTVGAPPRVVTSSMSPGGTFVAVCATGETFAVTAAVVADRTDESVEARWFVDYDPSPAVRRIGYDPASGPLPIPADATQTERPARLEHTTSVSAGHPIEILELVVAYGFAAEGPATSELPGRTPAPGEDTDVARWVFRLEPENARCTAAATSALESR